MPQEIDQTEITETNREAQFDTPIPFRQESQSFALESQLIITTPVGLQNISPKPPQDFVSKENHLGSPLFFTYLLFIAVSGFFYRSNQKSIKNIFESFVSDTTLNQILEERKSVNSVVNITWLVGSLLVFGIFIYQILKNTDFEGSIAQNPTGYGSIFIFLFGFIIAYFAKSLIIFLSSWIFNSLKPFNTYLTLNVISIQVLGAILLPLIILITYTYEIDPTWLIRLGIGISLLIFSYRLIRTFFLGLKQTNSNVFHIILYICALEILPLLLIGKLILSNQQV